MDTLTDAHHYEGYGNVKIAESLIEINNDWLVLIVIAAITIVAGETTNHTFVGADPEGQSLSWSFVDITGPGDIGTQPVFDPDLQIFKLATYRNTTPGPYVERVLAVDPGNAGDIGVLTINVEAPTGPLQCDIDGSGIVDRTDIGLIIVARNQPAEPGDPRDNDNDGVITVLDARQCLLLCTNARCAP